MAIPTNVCVLIAITQQQTMVKGALHLAAFTQESARRWVSALRLGSVSAPRERSNTFLEKLSGNVFTSFRF